MLYNSTILVFSKSSTLTSNNLAILTKVGKSGWELFVHHFETVDGFTFNCSLNHLFVCFFSAKTTFNRFVSVSMSIKFVIRSRI